MLTLTLKLTQCGEKSRYVFCIHRVWIQEHCPIQVTIGASVPSPDALLSREWSTHTLHSSAPVSVPIQELLSAFASTHHLRHHLLPAERPCNLHLQANKHWLPQYLQCACRPVCAVHVTTPSADTPLYLEQQEAAHAGGGRDSKGVLRRTSGLNCC